MQRIITDFEIKGESRRPLRETIAERYKDEGLDFPIKGGWGYSLEDAIIIDKNDPIIEKGLPFNGVGMEYEIVDMRLSEEFIYAPDKDEMYVVGHKQLHSQKTMNVDDRRFDHLVFIGFCFWGKDFEGLGEYYGINEHNPDFDKQAFLRQREMLKFYFKTEYYFDITSFFGKSKSLYA